MARTPMVTRTIVSTKATILCVDTEMGEVIHKDVVLPRTYKDDKALLKKASSVIETEIVKPVQVVYKEEQETLYGMSEEMFIEMAEQLPPRKDYTQENNEQ